MRSFQKQTKEPKRSRSIECTHKRSGFTGINKASSSGQDNQMSQSKEIQLIDKYIDNGCNTNMCAKQENMDVAFLRSIIAKNEQYFRDKLCGKENGKPNLTLKMPYKTSNTTYKNDYLRNSQSLNNLLRPKK